MKTTVMTKEVLTKNRKKKTFVNEERSNEQTAKLFM